MCVCVCYLLTASRPTLGVCLHCVGAEEERRGAGLYAERAASSASRAAGEHARLAGRAAARDRHRLRVSPSIDRHQRRPSPSLSPVQAPWPVVRK